jgi:5,10-methylenetetrahydromethanopterin reductase
MRIGVYFDGFASTEETLQMCQAAEAAGADSLWFAQHMGYRDAMTLTAMAAVATKRISLVPTAISPYMAPPLPVAMSMATMDEIAPGRLKLAVSVGNLLNLEQSGFEAAKPVSVIQDYVTSLRLLLEGDPVHLDGYLQRLRGARMAFGHGLDLPIYVASTGPKVLQMAGRLADGILLSAGMTLAQCRACLGYANDGVIQSGRPPGLVRNAGFINLNVSHDGERARRALLRKLAYLFRSKGHADNIKSSGLPIDHEGIIAAMSQHDLDKATSLLPLEAADVFGVAGTINECKKRLEAYFAIGITEPIVEISGDIQERNLALELIRDLAH